jgi:hypothetical protein
MGGWNNPQSGCAIGARQTADRAHARRDGRWSEVARAKLFTAVGAIPAWICLAVVSSAMSPGSERPTTAAPPDRLPVLREEAAFEPAGSEREPNFGRGVAIAGSAVVVACPREGDGGSAGGTAHVFGESKRGWRRTQRIRSPMPDAPDHFASAIAATGNRVVVGRDRADGGSRSTGVPSGAVTVYRRAGLHFQHEADLLPPVPEAGDEFGAAVAIDGTLIAVGSPRDDEGATDAGSVSLWTLRDDAWVPEGELRAPDPHTADWFGSAVAVAGDWVAVGAYGADPRGEKSGAVYLFRRSAAGWSLHMKLAPRDLQAGDWFGFALALDGDWLAVGAPRDDSIAESSGSVRLFERRGDEWLQTAELLPRAGSVTAWFGYALALDRDRLLVGAPGDDTRAESAGMATLFERRNGSWLARAELAASSPRPEERFGSSVDLRDDRLMVGRYASEDEPVGMPRAWLFRVPAVTQDEPHHERIRPGDDEGRGRS